MNKGILSVIGNTSIIKLEKIFPENRFHLYLKLEGMNPGGSAKDRSGYSMIEHAIEEGKINKNTVIVESSSGNLGVALAQICCYLGLKFICVVDVKTTIQNIKLLKAYGAEIEYVDKPDDKTGEFLQARLNRVNYLLQSIPNSYRPNQYSNEYNPMGHKKAMQEIAEYFNNNVDYVFCATSTCGTIRGYVDYVHEHNLKTKIIAVDAVGSIIFGGKPEKRLIPGHGAAVVPGLYRKNMVEKCIHVSDWDCIVGCHKLVTSEAILTGGSTGAIMSAVDMVKNEVEDNANCVMVMHDRGERYLDTIYSDDWVYKHFGKILSVYSATSISSNKPNVIQNNMR